MPIEVVQAIFVSVALGALIVAWAYLHFHAPYRTEDIRFSVSPRRYFLSLWMYICGVLAIYSILLLATYPAALLVMYGADMDKCWKCLDCKDDCGLDEQGIIWAALISAVCVRILMPNFALTRHILDGMRSLAHRLAQFPAARESVVASIAVSGFRASNDANLDVVEELSLYGITSYATTFLSESAMRSLLEVCSVRKRLQRLSDKSQTQRTIWDRITILVYAWFVSGSHSKKHQEIPDRHRLGQFWHGRATIWTQLETDFRRLLRRSARALLLVDDIEEQAPEKAVALAISNFVVEESDDVLTRYRRLIAEMALFCEPHRDRQEEFLKSFGYPAIIPLSLPLRPWIIVFVLDFLLFLIPPLLMQFTNGTSPIPVTPLALFACVHAISQTVAITWAIYPKIGSNFARPSVCSLPWQSYVVYGIASYLSGAAILFIFRINMPMPFPIVLPTLMSSFSFLLMTVGVSLLIDQHLRARFDDFKRPRLHDGAIIGLLMLAGTFAFQLTIFYVAPRFGWVDLDFMPPVSVRASFLLLSGSLGFVVGYIVPSAAASYLHEASLVPSVQGGGGLELTGVERASAARPAAYHG
jgi:hypothetical protein